MVGSLIATSILRLRQIRRLASEGAGGQIKLFQVQTETLLKRQKHLHLR